MMAFRRPAQYYNNMMCGQGWEEEDEDRGAERAVTVLFKSDPRARIIV